MTHVTHAKILWTHATHATHAKISSQATHDTHAEILWTHGTHATHAPMYPRTHTTNAKTNFFTCIIKFYKQCKFSLNTVKV